MFGVRNCVKSNVVRSTVSRRSSESTVTLHYGGSITNVFSLETGLGRPRYRAIVSIEITEWAINNPIRST